MYANQVCFCRVLSTFHFCYWNQDLFLKVVLSSKHQHLEVLNGFVCHEPLWDGTRASFKELQPSIGKPMQVYQTRSHHGSRKDAREKQKSYLQRLFIQQRSLNPLHFPNCPWALSRALRHIWPFIWIIRLYLVLHFIVLFLSLLPASCLWST